MRSPWRHLRSLALAFPPVALAVAAAAAIAALVALVAFPSTTYGTPPPTDPPIGQADETPSDAATDPSGRRWPLAVTEGCALPDLAEVVFLGTMVDSDFQTARYRIDQVRAGDLQPYAYGGLVDVRYGGDTRFLSQGTQYLIGANPVRNSTSLMSKVRVTEPLFAGDDVIGITESEVSCPQLGDPVRTLDADGTSVDTSVLGPMGDAKRDILRAFLIPLAVAVAIVFGLATVRWILTGVGKGVGAVVSTASQTREVRAAKHKDFES